jgi:Tat protein translocase TatB subunit
LDFLGIGPLEFLLIAVVFLLVLGPEKLPAYARKAGEFIAKARRTVNEAKSALTDETKEAGKGVTALGESVRKSIDLPPSPDFDLTFNFDPNPENRSAGSSGAKDRQQSRGTDGH